MIRVFLSLFFALFILRPSFAEEIDFNQDGMTDIWIKSSFNDDLKELIFEPSWDASTKIHITKYFNTSSRKIYKNSTLVQQINFERSEKVIKTLLTNYRDEKFTEKEIEVYAPDTNLLNTEKYKLVNDQWKLVSEKSKKLETTIKEGDGCDEYFPNNANVPTPYLNLKPFIRVTDGDYAYSKIGFKVDRKTCPEDAIKKIGEAIKEMREKYIPCLRKKRPNLTSILLMDLWEYESEIKCFPKKDGVAADTREYVGAGINIYGLSSSGSFYSHGLANTLLHEVLHHHLNSCRHHSKDLDKDDSIKDKSIRYDDGVYGCTELCEYEINKRTNRLTEKGCQECFNDDFSSSYFFKDLLDQDTLSRKKAKKQCQEHPYFKRRALCQKYKGNKDCTEYQMDAFEHKQFGECRDFYKKYKTLDSEVDCDSVTEIEKTMKPLFGMCYQKMLDRGFKGNLCMSTFIEIFDTPKFDTCLKNYGNDPYTCRSGYLLNKELHEDCKNLITPYERKSCMHEKYGVKHYYPRHHDHFDSFNPHPYRGFGSGLDINF